MAWEHKDFFQICRKEKISRSEIYETFFQAPFVKRYCDQEGIDEATLEASRRRCPFLLNILDACGIISQDRDSISVLRFVLMPALLKPYGREEREKTMQRFRKIVSAWPNKENLLENEDLSIVKELFGRSFLTDDFYLKDYIIFEG